MSDPLVQDDFDSERPGAELRRAREQAGIGLQQVADQTLIAQYRLEGLERDDYDLVGGRAYVIGYARAYARAIGVKPQPYIEALEANFRKADPLLSGGESVQASAARREKLDHRSVLPAALIVLLIAAVLGWFLVSESEQPDSAPRGADTAEEPAAPEPLRESEREASAEAVPEPRAVAGEEPFPAEPEPVMASEVEPALPPATEPAVAPGEPPAVASPAAERALSPAAPSDEPDRLQLSFSAECWVEVVDATGKRVIAQTAQSGDNLQLFGQAPFDITLGNAAAATVELNGEAVPVQSRGGRRVVRLRAGE